MDPNNYNDKQLYENVETNRLKYVSIINVDNIERIIKDDTKGTEYYNICFALPKQQSFLNLIDRTLINVEEQGQEMTTKNIEKKNDIIQMIENIKKQTNTNDIKDLLEQEAKIEQIILLAISCLKPYSDKSKLNSLINETDIKNKIINIYNKKYSIKLDPNSYIIADNDKNFDLALILPYYKKKIEESDIFNILLKIKDEVQEQIRKKYNDIDKLKQVLHQSNNAIKAQKFDIASECLFEIEEKNNSNLRLDYLMIDINDLISNLNDDKINLSNYNSDIEDNSKDKRDEKINNIYQQLNKINDIINSKLSSETFKIGLCGYASEKYKRLIIDYRKIICLMSDKLKNFENLNGNISDIRNEYSNLKDCIDYINQAYNELLKQNQNNNKKYNNTINQENENLTKTLIQRESDINLIKRNNANLRAINGKLNDENYNIKQENEKIKTDNIKKFIDVKLENKELQKNSKDKDLQLKINEIKEKNKTWYDKMPVFAKLLLSFIVIGIFMFIGNCFYHLKKDGEMQQEIENLKNKNNTIDQKKEENKQKEQETKKENKKTTPENGKNNTSGKDLNNYYQNDKTKTI